MDAQVSHKRGQVRISGEMTVYTAAELAPKLFATLAKHKASSLDLSGVAEFDTAGLQMLLAARRASAGQGRPLVLVDPSHVVLNALDLCRVPLVPETSQPPAAAKAAP
jgi:anti-anti-sigma factor